MSTTESDAGEARWTWGRLVWCLGWLAAAAVCFYHGARATWGPGAGQRASQPAAAFRLKRISEIRVGDRVLAENPSGEEDRALGEVDPRTWRRVELRATKHNGGSADIVLLRPASWLQEREARAGGRLYIAVPECGIDDNAEVLGVGPCPAVKLGRGRVVTGTFKHSSAQVLDLRLEGQEAPVGTTAHHLFWSEDEEDFVPAEDLEPGETLRTVQGTTKVGALTPRPGTQVVYNLEVEGAHTYHVGATGVLVHNGGPPNCPGVSVRRGPGPYTGQQKTKFDEGWERIFGKNRKPAVPKEGGSLERNDDLLARNLGGRRGGYSPHHLIGVAEAAKYPVMHRAAELGYNINRGNNGMNLPNTPALAKSENLPYHPPHGRHSRRTYTDPVNERLQALQERYDAGLVDDASLLDEVRLIENGIRRDLLAGKLRLNRRYPWYQPGGK
jgi:hypothetical protein